MCSIGVWGAISQPGAKMRPLPSIAVLQDLSISASMALTGPLTKVLVWSIPDIKHSCLPQPCLASLRFGFAPSLHQDIPLTCLYFLDHSVTRSNIGSTPQMWGQFCSVVCLKTYSSEGAPNSRYCASVVISFEALVTR